MAGRCTHLKPFKRTKLGPELCEHVCRMMDWLQQEVWNSPCLVQRKDRQLFAFVFSSNWHGERRVSEDITAHANEYSLRPKREDTSDCNLSGVITVSEFSGGKKTTKTLCKYRCMTIMNWLIMLIAQTKGNSSSPDLDIYKSWPSAHRNVTAPQGFFTFLHWNTLWSFLMNRWCRCGKVLQDHCSLWILISKFATVMTIFYLQQGCIVTTGETK